MPVKVEATIVKSKLCWLFPISVIGTSQFVFFLINFSFIIWPVTWLFLWFVYWHWQSIPQFDRITIEAEDVQLYNQSNKSSFIWQGLGQRSFAFIRFHLLDAETNEKLTLTLWRDSFSDASWRALNMGYRVNSGTARNDN